MKKKVSVCRETNTGSLFFLCQLGGNRSSSSGMAGSFCCFWFWLNQLKKKPTVPRCPGTCPNRPKTIAWESFSEVYWNTLLNTDTRCAVTQHQNAHNIIAQDVLDILLSTHKHTPCTSTFLRTFRDIFIIQPPTLDPRKKLWHFTITGENQFSAVYLWFVINALSHSFVLFECNILIGDFLVISGQQHLPTFVNYSLDSCWSHSYKQRAEQIRWIQKWI